MANKLKNAFLFLLQPKVIVFGVTAFLFLFISISEQRRDATGCSDCGWDARQAFLLLIASAGLLIGRFWSAFVSLLAAVKIIYSIGHLAFWNNIAEAHDGWRILNVSLKWTWEARPEYFVEIAIAVLVGIYSVTFIWHHISSKVFLGRDGI